MSETFQTIPRQTLSRLPLYYNLLQSLRDAGVETISAPAIADALRIGHVQVRKDLAAVSPRSGKPRTGFEVGALIEGIEHCLGYDSVDEAVLVGAGRLGQALLAYEGFESCGVRIVAAFDSEPKAVDAAIKQPIFPLEKLPSLCLRMGVHIGVITVPACEAQAVCDLLVQGGIRAIWNFAPVHLAVPEGVIVKHENIAVSLAHLSRQLGSSGDISAKEAVTL